MSAETSEIEDQEVESKPNTKEYNFRQIEKKLKEERAERENLARQLEEMRSMQNSKRQDDDDDDDDEPFVDHKKLKKKLAKFGEIQEKNTESKISNAVKTALQEERRKAWIENNPDFYDTLQNHAEKLAVNAPKLAESILNMPDSFERQQLVYNNIKALRLDQDVKKEPSIQDKIDANKRSPFYQPSGMGTAPYASQGDFSAAGQKNAYDKMKELQSRLRM